MKKGCLYLLLLAVISACNEIELPNEPAHLVVEGYIDAGGFPVVMLSKSLSIGTDKVFIDSLQDHILRWAKVTVSDGKQEVVLSGKYDKDYMLPYIYTTAWLRGEEGKTYTLKVDYKDFHATATTTIPKKPEIDSCVTKIVEGDRVILKVYFRDNPQERNFYKAFVTYNYNLAKWDSSFLGLWSDEVLSEHNEVIIHPPLSTEYEATFDIKQLTVIKFAQIDEQTYQFWQDFESQKSLQGNMFFSSQRNLHSNIEGGYGCWYGCGAVYFDLWEHI